MLVVSVLFNLWVFAWYDRLRSRSIDERSEHSTATTTAAAVQSHTQQLVDNSTSAVVPCQPPADVYERLAMRGKLKAMQTLHYDLPPSQVYSSSCWTQSYVVISTITLYIIDI